MFITRTYFAMYRRMVLVTDTFILFAEQFSYGVLETTGTVY